jgi:hypothetical protein
MLEPIIIVFPSTRYYFEALSPEFKKRFYNIVNELQEEYDIQFIDLSENHNLTDEDFTDFDHIGESGAIKITNIMRDLLYKQNKCSS